MAFVVKLIEGSEPDIDLFYSATDAWAMLDSGFQPNDPERRELWGGYLETILVRQEDGKRTIPLELQGTWTTPDELIDAVNALEERLRHAARYRIDGWGDEVFLRFQLHGSSYGVDFPASSGQINKTDLMNACNLVMESGHRVAKTIKIGVTLVCEPYWEATETYTLNNLLDNPGFWRGAVEPGDSWTEVDPAAALTLAWRTGTRYVDWQVMGQSLEWTIAPDAVNDVGITSDAQTVTSSTWYYWELRGFHTAGCDDIRASVWDVTGAPAEIVAARLTFDNGDDAWEKLGVAFQTGGACTSVEVRVNRMAADSTAGDKTFYLDAIYLDDGTDAPTGWCSGRNLVNHLDADADHLNVLCVTEIPGEVEAEAEVVLSIADTLQYFHLARKTSHTPCDLIWELLPVNAIAGTDTAIAGDGTAPGGQAATCTFATNQNMVERLRWNIWAAGGQPLNALFGKYAIGILAKATAVVDTITMKIELRQDLSIAYQQGLVYTKTIGTGTDWPLVTGWSVVEYPTGETDYTSRAFRANNRWQLIIHAAIAGAAPWDNLMIGGAYLIPLDQGYIIAGNVALTQGAGNDYVFRNMDGDRAAFFETGTVVYSNAGAVGPGWPLLSPEIENFLYLIMLNGSQVDITDACTVTVKYRPRGIFLRGTNP